MGRKWFHGAIIAEYIAENYGIGNELRTSWQQKDKLEALSSTLVGNGEADSAHLIADSNNRESLDELVSKPKYAPCWAMHFMESLGSDKSNLEQIIVIDRRSSMDEPNHKKLRGKGQQTESENCSHLRI